MIMIPGLHLHNRNAVCRIGVLGMMLLALLFTVPLQAGEGLEKIVFLVVENDKVIASNAMTGQFSELAINAQEEIKDHYVDKGVAIVVTNRRVAGYAALPGGWRSIRRISGEQFIDAQVEDYSALVITSERLLSFNGRTGAWSDTKR